MKTILIDAWNTFVKKDGVDKKIKGLLDKYPNNKIIVTNASDEERIKLGIVNMPYPIFSLSHCPEKTDIVYFKKLLSDYNLNLTDVIYIEHNKAATKKSQKLGQIMGLLILKPTN